jgi:ribose transport system substrate-binding protein
VIAASNGRYPRRTRALVALLAVLAPALAACGSTGSAASRDTVVSAGPVDVGPYCAAACRHALALGVARSSVSCRVAFVDDATSFPYGATQFTNTQQAARKYFPNMRLTVLNGNGDPISESQELETVVGQGYRVIILDAVVADALAPAVREATAKGAKIIEIDRTVNAPVVTTIKAPDIPLGEEAARYMVSQLHGKGNVAILSGTPGASPTISRTAGFMDIVRQYPGIHILANVNGNYDTAQAYQVTRDILARYGPGQLNWIFSEADNMALGALQAIKAAHRQQTLKMSGIDGQQQGLQAVAARSPYVGDVIYPTVEPEDVMAAAKECTGEPMPANISLLYPLATPKNAKKYLGTTWG